jgi:hypothetical protein
MKKIKLLFALSSTFYLAQSQQRQNGMLSKPAGTAGVVTPSRLQTYHAGLPIEMAVLRYNDTVLLTVQPNEVNPIYVFFEPKNNGLDF